MRREPLGPAQCRPADDRNLETIEKLDQLVGVNHTQSYLSGKTRSHYVIDGICAVHPGRVVTCCHTQSRVQSDSAENDNNIRLWSRAKGRLGDTNIFMAMT